METNQLLFIYPSLRSHTEKQHNDSSLQFVLRGCFLFKWFQVEVFFIYLSFLFDVFLLEGEIEAPLICRFPVIGAAAHYILVNVFGMAY